jgi:quinolinate synthase
MNETTLEDVYKCLKDIKDGKEVFDTEIFVNENVTKWAKVALQRMFEV